MFKKPVSAPTTGAAPPPPSPRISPAIASSATGMIWADPAPRGARGKSERPSGIVIEGSICGDAAISVNGRIKGDVDVASLNLDEAGMIEGRVVADQVDIHGQVLGDIHASVILLHPKARVRGDLTYAHLCIDMGAEFQGACHQLVRAAPAAVVAAVAPPSPESDEPPSVVEVDAPEPEDPAAFLIPTPQASMTH
ncbi:hypothetical protein BH09PSE2_BH09PSE2_01380 [soil metagenome]